MRTRWLACVAAFICVVTTVPDAADTWVEVRSPNFRVISNHGERSARDLATQFEQIRSGIAQGWPWAQTGLDRPLLIVGVKDEATLRSFAPQYWEANKDPRLSSVSASAWDRHYIVIRTDIKVDDEEGVNPYRSAYWTYCNLLLTSSFNYRLPLWFSRGMAAVLSNTNVTDREIQFGRAVPSYMQEMAGVRLPLPELLAADRTSPIFRDPILNRRFDAQAWGLLHFMLFGSADTGARESPVNVLARLLTAGTPSAAAVEQTFGPLAELDTAYRRYIDRRLTRFVTVKSDIRVSTREFTAQPVAQADALAIRAGILAGQNRAADARSVMAEARALAADNPATYEVEGLLLEREQNPDAARAAYDRAIALGSRNYIVYARLGTLLPRQPDTAARRRELLERSVALNDSYAMAQQALAAALSDENRLEDALAPARRAIALIPGQVPARLTLASLLSRLGRKDEAIAEAQAAMKVAATDADRAMVQRMLDSFARI